MTAHEAVFPSGRQALYERNRYSPAIKSNGFLFVSGQVGSREDGSPEPDLKAQVRLAFDNLNAVLAAAGCTFAKEGANKQVISSQADSLIKISRIWA
ncbi:Rid family hydrolase, partial [Enterobacter roggenkampii]|uniref:Rid family hydrolase n=1 Tax=Enterobacter roggenkampii TaxID=1812935 RepID=UPI002FFA88AE